MNTAQEAAFDDQDVDELIRLISTAQAEEMLEQGNRRASNRLIELNRLLGKVIGLRPKTPDMDEARMLDGRQPPFMGNTQEDEAY
ncbi:MAG: hypothetical protein M3094_05315 [Actinomycetia bacterium]|nr:hypothetical protein [Actinomycetes bacterium]